MQEFTKMMRGDPAQKIIRRWQREVRNNDDNNHGKGPSHLAKKGA
jgi:hypothetical protein